MTIDRQIEDARQTLEDLTADEAELSRLEAAQLAEIQTLKDAGSKDFAGLAALEGKRAALSSMLAEQRGHMERARAHLNALTAAKARGDALDALRGCVRDLQARRVEADALLSELGAFLRSHLPRIVAARVAWADELDAAYAFAGKAFDVPHPATLPGHSGSPGRTAWSSLFAELGEGAADALLQSPNGKHAQGITRALEPVTHGALVNAVTAAKTPLIRYFDRPVSLVIAEALADVDAVTPHPLRGGEQ